MKNKFKLAARLGRVLRVSALAAIALISTGALAAVDGGPRPHAKGHYDAATDSYEVAAGDDLATIGRRFGITVGELKTLNALSGGRILIGQELIVVAAGAADPPESDASQSISGGDPLPSWNDGPSKQAIVDFVHAVTDSSNPGYVPESERIATFDNDGTLWVEHPMYTQLVFALDRSKALAPQHPEWQPTQPFKAVLENDPQALTGAGEKGLVDLILTSHAGMTTTEFEAIVTGWLDSARHPRFKRPYTDLTYQPMQELLAYLRANGFKTFIVSGCGVEFMRPMTEQVYRIPPEQVVGSTIKTQYRVQD
ncbi:MAG: haloacid dehalogenase-like hydrolase [Thiohalocapsa sp.]